MKIHYDIKGFSATLPVVSVGVFDGVHRGHKYIIEKLNQIARHYQGESVIVTLWPHPRIVLNKTPDLTRLLTTLEEKISLLENAGLDHLVILKFTKNFSRLTSFQFIKEYLVKNIGVKHLFVGYNHRLGRDREGDVEKLKDYAVKFDFMIEQSEPFYYEGENVSSSSIRKALLQGNIPFSNKMLGYPYFVSGRVVGGSRIGRSIGFPTANIQVSDNFKLIPKEGVYAVEVIVGKEKYNGMLNIGTRPTVNKNPEIQTIEAHVIDFMGDLYDLDVKIIFIDRIRDEIEFDDIEGLKAQLVKDKLTAKKIFKEKELRC